MTRHDNNHETNHLHERTLGVDNNIIDVDVVEVVVVVELGIPVLRDHVYCLGVQQRLRVGDGEGGGGGRVADAQSGGVT